MLEIIRFELLYRLKRPATYIYFGVLFLLTFLTMTTDAVSIGGAMGNVHRNSPYSIHMMVMIMTMIGSLICSAIMGVPILRDFEHKFHEIYYTTPIKKMDYLIGRFIGSYLIAIFVLSGLLFGIWFGSLMPWIDAETLGQNQLSYYINPFLSVVIPNMFFLGAIFFMIGALTRKILFVYLQGILFIVFYIVSQTIISKSITHESLAAVLDPMGLAAQSSLTKYWTPAEKNTLITPFTGVWLSNRLIWIGIGLVLYVAGFLTFKFRASGISFKKSKIKEENTSKGYVKPFISFAKTISINPFQQLLSIAKLEFRSIYKSVPFVVLLLIGLFNVILNLSMNTAMYDVSTYPVTSGLVKFIDNSFSLFMLIMVIFYVGEVIWRERGFKMEQIAYSIPVSNGIILFGKFISICLMLGVIYTFLMVVGIIYQAVLGYTHFEVDLYIKYLFGISYLSLLHWVLLAFFIHVLVNNKFMGHGVVILFFIANIFLQNNSFEHGLYRFGYTPNFAISDMNRFGHFLQGHIWFWIYWTIVSTLFFTFAIGLFLRGSDSTLKLRLKSALNKWKGKNALVLSVLLLSFFLCGGFIYYNTNVINKYSHADKSEMENVDYELKYKSYQNIPTPKIVAVKNKVDIYPEERRVKIAGSYLLKNKTQVNIDSFMLMFEAFDHIKNLHIHYTNPQNQALVFKRSLLGYEEINIEKIPTLLPNDSIYMNFEYEYEFDGFENGNTEGRGNNWLVHNGTFFDSGKLPAIGYSEGFELSDKDKRRKYKLPAKELTHPITDSSMYSQSYISNNSDMIQFETVVSTSVDQMAIAPGYLQKEWTENNRRYFHYKMDSPVFNFYSYISARFEVKKDVWNPSTSSGTPVNIEIYYHKDHAYNVDRMISSIKKSLDYFTKNFGPYQHKQVRIIEFPKYAQFAQSFPNTIPFSESIGFILDQTDPEKIDVSYYVTSHEVAHQWWGHQVCSAPVDGMTVMVETMAQYSALMVMEKEYGREIMRSFLNKELTSYLRGRGVEKNKEMPLLYNQQQDYIHYRKGSLVMYALKEYIGEDKVNKAVKGFLDAYKFKGAPYPTAINFYEYIQAETPDSLKGLVSDLFTKITLYDNICEKASYKKLSDKQYEITLKIKSNKLYADSLGNETKVPVNEWIEVGALDEKDRLIYSEKRKINAPEMTLTFKTSVKPEKAGIDPMNVLIDRDGEDNVKVVSE